MLENGAPDQVRSLEDLVGAGHRFGTIYADPPWQYHKGYKKGESIKDLAALPVPQLAADDSHLHLWATVPLLPEALALMEEWGFTYKSQFVWPKNQLGMGNYWRVSHELLLLGVRGKAKRFADRGLKSWATYPQPEHSAKPEEIRQLIERASPGPYLELFGRQPVPGWTIW